jgi:FlaA1/EpsC-like NDP-sugar epimerase
MEANPLAGLANNALFTRVECQAAQRCALSKVVLISTDRAVRPTNVMGASKRVAKLIEHASAQEGNWPTRFAIVRFGNLLGSSGSVVPLFRRQIAEGGPITLTHPEIVRFFMTIPEAAQLVLQAVVQAQGGDMFLLDMGEPVLIKHLAEQMVRLSGHSVRDAQHPSGDIEIVCTGLRPGEKLYEELLIDANLEPTNHPLIYRAHEQLLPPEDLWPQIDALEAAINRRDVSFRAGLAGGVGAGVDAGLTQGDGRLKCSAGFVFVPCLCGYGSKPRSDRDVRRSLPARLPSLRPR